MSESPTLFQPGIVEGVFKLARPVTGASSWCPPMRGGQLDLRRLGVD